MQQHPLREAARRLRREMTDAERLLWRHLRRRQLGGHYFRRQMPLGPYIVDFVCVARRLIVELDGSRHLDRLEYDDRRTRWLESQGYRVVRYFNDRVLTETAAVLDDLWERLEPPSPQPSPKGEGAQTLNLK